jgi:hypothetical protein
MMSMRLVFVQNMRQRQTLIQKLDLESEFLEACLVRSEALLRESSKAQAPLRLIRRFADEDQYNSLLDFLVAVFVPALKPRIFDYYHGDGSRLIEHSDWADLDRLDRTLVTALHELRALYDELRSAAWRKGEREFTPKQVTAAWLDLHVRPRFAVPAMVEIAERRAA